VTEARVAGLQDAPRHMTNPTQTLAMRVSLTIWRNVWTGYKEDFSMGEQLLTTIQVAEMLGLKPSYLELLRHQGKGPVCIKLGYRTVRYAPSAVQAWVEQQTQRPVTPQAVTVEGKPALTPVVHLPAIQGIRR
jgi:predicted DNA-binding transcriptional regulator AlpA